VLEAVEVVLQVLVVKMHLGLRTKPLVDMVILSSLAIVQFLDFHTVPLVVPHFQIEDFLDSRLVFDSAEAKLAFEWVVLLAEVVSWPLPL